MEYAPKEEVAVASGGAAGGEGMVVCVTGAGGYIASWLVKILLSKGYTVHGTVRDLKGVGRSRCEWYPECSQGIIRCRGEKVVFVSSGAAIVMTPNPPENNFYDEECWSDGEYCRITENWYCLSKTLAEKSAWECAKERSLELVTVCPTLNLGPMLQNSVNASSLFLLKLLRGEKETVPNVVHGIIDVRDVAEALVLVYENREASGRYICNAHHVRTSELVDILKRIYPNYKYPKQYTDGPRELSLSSKKLQCLGWSFRPLEEILVDSVESFRARGLLE